MLWEANVHTDVALFWAGAETGPESGRTAEGPGCWPRADSLALGSRTRPSPSLGQPGFCVTLGGRGGGVTI